VTAIDSPLPAHGQAHGSDHADAHGHGHHGQYPFLAHHFETPQQQFDSGKLGMWIFLATEVLFFGALFALYAVMRAQEPEVFAFASHYLSTIMGGINTCVLILSSLTMAMAVHYAQRGRQKALLVCLALTFLGACGFLVIKFFEYRHKIHEHLVWGPGFYMPVQGHPGGEHGAIAGIAADARPDTTPARVVDAERTPLFQIPPVDSSVIRQAPAGPAGLASPKAQSEGAEAATGKSAHVPHLFDPNLPVNTHRFFAIYFAMTGLHGIHVVVGMGIIGWLIIGAMKGRFNGEYYTPVDLGGLYWHIVDLIWIFLFPLFYLIH
jgi:cytochrome c oxidase subunit 3